MKQLGGYLPVIASDTFCGIFSVIILFISRFGAVPGLFSMTVRMFPAGVFLLLFSVQRLTLRSLLTVCVCGGARG